MSSGLVVLDISKDCITFIFNGEGVFLDSLTHEDVLHSFETLGTNNLATRHRILVCVDRNQCFLPFACPVFIFVYLSNLGPNRHKILCRKRINYLINKYFRTDSCEFRTPRCKEQ